MRHDKLERELDMLLLLTENHDYTIEKACQKLGISRRNFYYYLEFFRDCGFIVEKHGSYYRIRRESPFFTKLTDTVSFTEDEAVTMRQLLDSVDRQNAVVEKLKRKLERFYDLDILSNEELRRRTNHNVSIIYDAIKFKQMAVLKNYSSPHGHSRKDRIVEPFMLMNNNNEVRCFEPSSGMNKTFKLSRMEDVQLLDLRWSHEDKHRRMYTDVFMFSDDKQMDIRLRLGQLSCSVLKEEYPTAARYLTKEDDSHWLLVMPVCSYKGIGRFVLGLFEDIEVLGDDAFLDYIREKIQQMAKLYPSNSGLIEVQKEPN
jgi:predicted DNA-binding transcriptional regulator YafY